MCTRKIPWPFGGGIEDFWGGSLASACIAAYGLFPLLSRIKYVVSFQVFHSFRMDLEKGPNFRSDPPQVVVSGGVYDGIVPA